MRAAFRKLGTLTAMPWGFFVILLIFNNPVFAGERPWRVSLIGVGELGFAKDYNSACSNYASRAISKFKQDALPNSYQSTLQLSYSHPQLSSHSAYSCMFKTQHGDLTGIGLSAEISLQACLDSDSKDLYFSGSVVQINGQSLAAVDPPSQFCQKGCNYNRQSSHNSCSINGEQSTCSYTFVSDGSACDTAPGDMSDPSEKPEDFDSGTGSGGSGDGDTGGTGGDSGGCASGIGCDNGSGSGGGGDSGGGDTGGGDSGGGDTGGGDSGGGDTGGGDTGGGGTGTTGGATSADIRNLGDRITNAIAGHYNSLASSIAGLGDRLTGKLDQLGDKVDQLNGPAFSEGDVPGEAGGTAPGSDAGNDLAGQITDAVDQAVAEREAGLRDDLGTIDGMVSDWFGPGGNNIDSNDLLGSMFPAPSGCRDYVLPVHRDIVLTLPVCRLAAIKPLLEWVFAVLTAIGVWRILMNGLLGSAGRSTSGRR